MGDKFIPVSSNAEKIPTNRIFMSNFYLNGLTNIVLNAYPEKDLHEKSEILTKSNKENFKETCENSEIVNEKSEIFTASNEEYLKGICEKQNLKGTKQNISEKGEEAEHNKNILLYNINEFSKYEIYLSLILYISDIVSDLVLGIIYLYNQEWGFGFFTFFLVVGTAILYNLFDENSMWSKAEWNSQFWFWNGPFIILNTQPALQMCENIETVNKYLRYKKEEYLQGQIKKHEKYITGYKKVAILMQDESFWETIPQIIFQLFILFSTYESDQYKQLNYDGNNNKFFIFQLIAISTSALGLLTTQFTYHRAFDFPHGESVSFYGVFLIAIGCTISLIFRATAIICLLFVKPLELGCLQLFLHLNVCIIWWQMYVWESNGPDTFAEGLCIMLQPSLKTPNQCFLSNVILFICNFVSFLLWVYTNSDFYNERLYYYYLLVFCLVDVLFRTILVLYWWKKDLFIKKAIHKEEL